MITMVKKKKELLSYGIGERFGGFLYRALQIPTFKRHYKEIKKMAK